MSARMPGTMTESNKSSVDVHDWLEQINSGIGVAELGSSPLSTVCSSAVDPLEIAVALEVAGISHAVATNRYNRADVFALARTLWSQVPHRQVPAKPAKLPRAGDWRDLARGVLYILPAVMLLALTKALDIELAKWVLPVAISWGWGLGQVTAFAGYTIQDAGMPYEAIIMVRVLAGAAVSTWIVSTLATMVAGGGGADVAATTALVTYMVASAILLVPRRRGLAGGAAPTGCACLRLRPGPIQRIGVVSHCRSRRHRRFVLRRAVQSEPAVPVAQSGYQKVCRTRCPVRIKAPAARRHLRCGRLAHCDPARSPLRRQQVRSPPAARPSPRLSRSDGMATPHVPRTHGPAAELAGQHQTISAAGAAGVLPLVHHLRRGNRHAGDRCDGRSFAATVETSPLRRSRRSAHWARCISST